MSFSMTTRQYRERSKTVTRRRGWANLKPGEIFIGVEKCQGLKKGQRVVRLGPARCISNRPEPLNAISKKECVREGFPELEPDKFIEMFARHNRCVPDTIINRIEFEYL